MSKDKLEIMLETMCCYFGLKKPLFVCHNKRGGGCYSYKNLRRKGKLIGTYRRHIFVSLQYHGGADNLLIHEFAHFLAHSRADFRPDRTGDHGPAFRLALTEVAVAWYGNAALYPWHQEYKRLAAAGPCELLD